MTAFSTAIHCATEGRITAINHLINVFKFSITWMKGVFNFFKVFTKNLLENVHKLIMKEVERKENPNPSRMRGRGADASKTLFYAGLFLLNSFERGDALSSMFFGQLICGAAFAPFISKETVFGPEVMIPVIILGAVQVGLAYIFFSIGTKYTDPVTASIINAIEPILNPVLVAVFYGETLGKLAIAGAVIVIGGILFYNIKNSVSKQA